MKRSDWVTLTFIVLSVAVALGATSWFFLIERDYDFVAQLPCDPSSSTCFVYECAPEEECEDGVSYYSIARIKARDFESCESESCVEECTSGTIECRIEECDAEAGGACSTMTSETLAE